MHEFYQIISLDGPITTQHCCVFLACSSKQGSDGARACARVGLGACRAPGAAKTKPVKYLGWGRPAGESPGGGCLWCCDSSHTFGRGLSLLHSKSWGSWGSVGMDGWMDTSPYFLLCSFCAAQTRRLVKHSQKNTVPGGIK